MAFVLSSASLAASCVLIVNGESLDCVEMFRKWVIASQNPNSSSSIVLWECLALPFTSLVWYVPDVPLSILVTKYIFNLGLLAFVS